jgi:hypothetical protein
MSMPAIRRIRFEAVPAAFVGDGILLRPRSRGDLLTLYLHEGHITKGLCNQLTRYHQNIIGFTLTCEDRPADGLDPSAGRVITNGRYEFVPAAALPVDRACWPMDADGEFIWQIREREMSEELRRELNTYIAGSLSTHQWVQH